MSANANVILNKGCHVKIERGLSYKHQFKGQTNTARRGELKPSIPRRPLSR